MVSLNKVFLGGNLTRDPELRYTPSNTAVTNIGLAINRNYLDRNNQKVEETTFVEVVIWSKQAENVCKYLKRGSPVLVEGALQFDSWEQDGKKRSQIKVRASNVQFLGSPRGSSDTQASYGNQGAQQTSSFAGNTSQGGQQPPVMNEPIDDFPENDIPF